MPLFEEISVPEAQRRLEGLHAIDVRTVHEFRGPLGRVPAAKLVPLPELEARAKELPSGRPLLLICRSGARSSAACEKLQALGIGPVLNLAGGMIAWNRAQLPIETTEPASVGELLDGIALWLAQVTSRAPDTARGLLRERLGACFERPTHATVHEALRLVGELLGASAPPDLDLTLASFRRSLAVL
jgi:rhodanese-related sulfurtransferase